MHALTFSWGSEEHIWEESALSFLLISTFTFFAGQCICVSD